MHKQFLLIFVIIFNLSMYSQVVIKDEIILYETENPDAETLTMPFYGKVSGGVNWGAIWWGWLKQVKIEAGGQVVIKSCPVTCAACYVTASWAINNLPLGTPVTVTVYSHCINGQLVEAETRLVNTGMNEYNIEYYNPNQLQWYIATSIKFIPTTPTFCGEVPECEYSSLPNFFFNEIESNTYTLPGTQTIVETCTTDIAGGQAGGMKMTPWHVPEGYIWNVNPCANPENGDIKFPFEFIGGGNTSVVPYVYLVGLCDNNSSHQVIKSSDNMMEQMENGEIESEDYCNLLHDICAHYGSDPNNPGYIPLIKFVLEDVVLSHERMHFERYEREFQGLLPQLQATVSGLNMSCQQFNEYPSEEEAINVVKGWLKNIFESFGSQVEAELNIYGRDNIEEEILTSRAQWDLIIAYYNRLTEYLGLNYCPQIDACDNLTRAF